MNDSFTFTGEQADENNFSAYAGAEAVLVSVRAGVSALIMMAMQVTPRSELRTARVEFVTSLLSTNIILLQMIEAGLKGADGEEIKDIVAVYNQVMHETTDAGNAYIAAMAKPEMDTKQDEGIRKFGASIRERLKNQSLDATINAMREAGVDPDNADTSLPGVVIDKSKLQDPDDLPVIVKNPKLVS